MGNPELITGEAGSGKTSYCVERYINCVESSGPESALFILPGVEAVEDARDSIFRGGVRGLFSPGIFTFRKLLDYLTGDRYTGAVISEAAREMILEKIIGELREEGRLDYLRPVALFRGTPSLIRDFIVELKHGSVSAAEFSAVTKRKDSSRKDEEISRIYTLYEHRLKRYDLLDEQDLYLKAKEKLEGEPDLGREIALILIDGFHSFTPAQRVIVKLLMARCGESVVTLQYNPDRPDVFRAASDTYRDIRDVRGVQERFFKAPAPKTSLSYLRENIFTPERLIKDPPPADDSLELITAGNVYREVEEIAIEIKRLAREERAEPDDICILFRSAAFYSDVLREVFGRYGIPIRPAKGDALSENPMVRVVRAVLQLAVDNWKTPDMLRAVKSGYVKISGLDPLLLERLSRALNMVEGYGGWMAALDSLIRKGGERPSGPGDGRGGGRAYSLKKLQSARAALKDVQKFFESTLTDRTVRDLCQSVRGIISYFKIESSCRPERGISPDTLRRDIKALERFEQCMSDMAGVNDLLMGDCESVALREFLKILDMELACTVYHYGERKGRGVTVMDIHSARTLKFPYVFIGGLLEGVFPHPPLQDALYRDDEREDINRSCRFRLEKRSFRLLAERHLFYAGITRAGKRLYLSRAQTDEIGREKLPSYYISEVKRLFKNSSLKETGGGFSEIIHPVTRLWNREELLIHLFNAAAGRRGGGRMEDAKLMENLLGRFRKTNRDLYRCVRWAAEIERVRSYVKKITSYDGYISDPGVRKAIRASVGKETLFSVTQLNTYGRCPFSFFLRYVMRLKPLEEPADELTPIDRGAMLHRILFRFFTTLKKRGVRLEEMDNSAAEGLILEAADGVFIEFERSIGGRVPPLWMLQREEISRQLKEFLKAEDEWGRAPGCRVLPKYFEFQFGMGRGGEEERDAASTLKPFVSRDGVRVAGGIDRIDISPDGRFMVTDYKLGEAFDWKDALEGVDLQLPIYIQAAGELLSGLGLRAPVGGCYLSMRDFSRCRGMWRKEYNGRYFLMSARCGSLIDVHTWNGMMEAVNDHIIDYVRRIREGDFGLRPKRCERWCEFAGICRYDEWRLSQKTG